MAEEEVTEVLFDEVGELVPTEPEEDDYNHDVAAIIADAVDFEESYLAPEREINIRYFYGEVPDIDDDDGIYSDPYDSTIDSDEEDEQSSSTFVSMDVRDTVMMMLPSLIRIFTSAENVVNFIPNTAQQVELAKQQTDYINHIFWEENDGFLLIHSILKDALIVRTGIVKWWTDVDREVREEEFRNVTEDQVQLVLSENQTCQLISAEPSVTGFEGRYDVVIRWVEEKPKHRVMAVPPDEFRISSDAKSLDCARLVGHEYYANPSDLVKMGIDREKVMDKVEAVRVTGVEQQFRNAATATMAREQKLVLYGEYFIRIDKDGDGIDELRKICTIGGDHEIVRDEVASTVDFAVFCGDPTPHTAIGEAEIENVKDIQRIKTNMMRSALDNLANSVVPRTAINEMVTNVRDVLNGGQSPVVRTRGNPADAIMDLTTPFVGAQVFDMTRQMDEVRANRTGITEASKGLDPKAMQSTAVSGIDAIVTGAQERIELTARILAETGFKRMFSGLLREVVNNPSPRRTIQLRGKWVEVEPSTYDANMKCKVNPTLGKGSDMTRMMVLQDIKSTQMLILEKFGIKNPIVTPQEFMNTIHDLAEIGNVKSIDRYFRPITPDIMESIMGQPDEPSPEAILAKAELEKVRSQTVKAIADKNFDREKLAIEDDFKRDKLAVDAAIQAMGIFAKFPAAPEPRDVTGGMNEPNRPVQQGSESV